jgi:TPR repeat protein
MVVRWWSENIVMAISASRVARRSCLAFAIAAGIAKRVLIERGVMTAAAAVLLALLLVTSARADVAAGLTDFRAGRFAEAFVAWRDAAGSGDSRGALFVGVLYDAGLGVRQDHGQALAWYRSAADAGNVTGMFNVGVMYDAGRGVQPDPGQAAVWYARAAAHDFGRAEYDLALLYEGGVGVPRNPAYATRLFVKAARHGISAAQAHLVRLGYQVSAPVQPAVDVAMDDLQRAENILLSRGPAEASEAAELFRHAADTGNALAEYDLGYCYEHGLGVQRDLVEAHALYRRAAVHAADGFIRSIATEGYVSLESQIGRSQSGQ